MEYRRRSHVPIIILVVILGLAVSALAIFFIQSRLNPLPHLITAAVSGNRGEAFPDIETAPLTQSQQKIVSILKAEHQLQPRGTKYAEGIKEPWCADFVSWVMREAGLPLSNPNSGSWRIPGTYTLREYYQSAGKFQARGSGYSPKVGDVVLYDNPSIFGQHTNFVIKNENGRITTVGGNESRSIRVRTHNPEQPGLLGYGVL